MIKSLLFVCCLVFSASVAKADIAKPKPPEKAAKYVLNTKLEIAPDPKAYEAILHISESQLKAIQTGLNGAQGNAAIAASITQSPVRTIVAGLLMFLSVSIAGVLLARSSFGRRQKAVMTLLVVAVVIVTAAIVTRGNAGPQGLYYWGKLPRALSEGKATTGAVIIAIVPDDALPDRTMRLIIPVKKQNSSGEE